MKVYKGKIKEKNNETILTPVWYCSNDVPREDAEKYWGCHKDDVEWFEIEEETL